VFAAACERAPGASASGASSDPADSILIPERRVRAPDPDSDEPMVTLVVALQHEARTRFILARGGLQSAPLTVVADSAGRIPVFASEADARAYAARNFPPTMPGADSLDDSTRAALATLLAPAEVTRVDFDRALAWAANPASRGMGPYELAMVWEILSGAGAAHDMAPFDPMSMPSLNDQIRSGGQDSAMAEILMTGMILSGMVSEARRRGQEDDAPWPPYADSVWTAANDALLARIIRAGVTNMMSRLAPMP
jgi:hypothetical protein